MLNNPNQEARTLSWRERLHGPLHERVLWIYMVIVMGHWLEHLCQVYQVYVWGWAPKQAGGVLGLWFPALVESEVLHFTYNLLLWGGIVLLLPGFRGRARKWWYAALAVQSWHFFEHILLQVQWLTGWYLFGATQQMGIGQLWFPRVELHFFYNLIVFVPLLIGTIVHFYSGGSQPRQEGNARPQRGRRVAASEISARTA